MPLWVFRSSYLLSYYCLLAFVINFLMSENIKQVRRFG